MGDGPGPARRRRRSAQPQPPADAVRTDASTSRASAGWRSPTGPVNPLATRRRAGRSRRSRRLRSRSRRRGRHLCPPFLRRSRGAGPIPLVNKKVPTGDVSVVQGELAPVSGESPPAVSDPPPVKRRVTPGNLASIALEPTVQVKVDPRRRAARVAARCAHARARAGLHASGPTQDPAPMVITPPPSRSAKTPNPGAGDAGCGVRRRGSGLLRARGNLYKREAVETFDNLDPSGGNGNDSRPKPRRRRK